MATAKSKASSKKSESKNDNVVIECTRAYFFKDSDTPDTGCIASATIIIDKLITLYGVQLCKNKDGEFFIGFPSHKGSDNKYYKHYYLDNEAILDQIAQSILDEE